MPYLLDADWVIHALAGHPQTTLTLRDVSVEGVAVGWITVGEVYEGACGWPNPQDHLAAFRRFLRPFPILNLNDAIMERFANIRSFLRRRGEIIPDFDIILGATALHHDLTVLTYNIRHLQRIPNIRLYGAG